MNLPSCRSNKLSKQGFTLIELLVVIAIIAILAAILFPVFAKARGKARQMVCLSNLKQIGMAVTQYTQDFDEVYPLVYGDTGMWTDTISPYVKMGGSGYAAGGSFIHCPDDVSTNPNSALSYSLNPTVSGIWSDSQNYHEASHTLAQINSPANVAYGAEGNRMWFGGSWNDCPVETDWARPMRDLSCPSNESACAKDWYTNNWIGVDFTDLKVMPWNCAPAWSCKGPDYRHARNGLNSGFANMIFCDGHAKAISFGRMTLANVFPDL